MLPKHPIIVTATATAVAIAAARHCCKPSDQPRDAARREECSDLDKKSLTTFCRYDGRAKGIAREHQNGFYET